MNIYFFTLIYFYIYWYLKSYTMLISGVMVCYPFSYCRCMDLHPVIGWPKLYGFLGLDSVLYKTLYHHSGKQYIHPTPTLPQPLPETCPLTEVRSKVNTRVNTRGQQNLTNRWNCHEQHLHSRLGMKYVCFFARHAVKFKTIFISIRTRNQIKGSLTAVLLFVYTSNFPSRQSVFCT